MSFAEAQRVLLVVDDALDKLSLANILTDEVLDYEFADDEIDAELKFQLSEMRNFRENIAHLPRVLIVILSTLLLISAENNVGNEQRCVHSARVYQCR